MKGGRIIIFGCGYVGRALAGAAVAAGYEVWISSRNADSLAQVESVPHERKIIANLQDHSWHDCFPGEWDAVFNLVSSAGGGIDGYRISYLEGNRSILEWAERGQARRLIYTSATSVYPQSDGRWVAEEDVPDPEAMSPSGRILREAELEILESDAIPERFIARLAGIYGPGRHLYLDRILEGVASIPGDGTAWLNLIYLADVVEVLLRLAALDQAGPVRLFNVVDDQPARKQGIVDWLAEQLGIPAPVFDPSREFARTSRRQAGGTLPNRRVSNRRLREALGWKPQFPDYQSGYRDILTRMGQWPHDRELREPILPSS